MVLDAAVASILAAGSRMRRARVFHPDGVAHRARIELTGAHGLPAGHHAGVARLSRGVGLPDPLPDVLGLAIRVHDAGPAERGTHQDLPLATGGAGPLRHLLVPARDPGAATYSSLTRFRLPDGEAATLLARPVGGSRQFEVTAVAGGGRDPALLATVVLDDPLPEAEGQALRFDIWRHRALLEPLGWLNGLRRRAYPASQAARPDAAAAAEPETTPIP